MSGDNENLVPGFILYIDGVRLAPIFEYAMKHISVTGRINSMSSFSITLSDPGHVLVNMVDLFIAAQVEIHMGYLDAVAPVCKYEVTGARAYFGSAGTTLTLEGHCPLHRLNHAKTNRGYTELNTADILNKIAGNYSLTMDTDVQDEAQPFTLQRNMTDFEYMLMLSRHHGCSVWAYDKTIYFRKETDSGEDELVLERGKTLTAFSGGSRSEGLFTQVAVRGRDPKDGKIIEAEAGPDKIKKKTGKGIAGPAHIEKNLAVYKQNVFDYSVTDKKGAEERAALILEQNSMEYKLCHGECEGNPKIKAGMTITIKGMGDEYSDKYLVTQVNHELVPNKGYVTRFELASNTTNKGVIKKHTYTPVTVTPAKKKDQGKLTPEFSNLAWKDKEEKTLENAYVGDKVILTADVKNMEKGGTVKVKVWEKDADDQDDPVDELEGKVKNGKMTCKWEVVYVEDTDDENSEQEQRDKGYTLPEYVFTVESTDGEVVSGKGPLLKMADWIEINLKDPDGKPAVGVKYVVSNMNGDQVAEGTLDANGYAKVENIGVSKRYVVFPELEEKGILITYS